MQFCNTCDTTIKGEKVNVEHQKRFPLQVNVADNSDHHLHVSAFAVSHPPQLNEKSTQVFILFT